MTHLPYPKSNLKILGKIFKMHRMQKGYSIRGIARSENIAHTMISDIETGKIYSNIETLERLFKQINLKLIIDLDELASVKDEIDLFHEAAYHKDPHFLESCFESIKRHSSSLFLSLLIIDILFVEEIYDILVLQSFKNSNLEMLENFYHDFSESQKHRFNLIMGSKLYKTGYKKEALVYLQRNLKIVGNPKAYAVTLTYIALCYQSLFNTHNMIDYGRMASKMHAEFANLNRKIEADFIVVRGLLDVGRFDDAQSILTNIQLTIHQDANTQIYESQLDFSRSYLYYCKGMYEESLALLDRDHVKTLAYYPFYKSLILYRSNRIDEAVKTLEEYGSSEAVQNDFVYARLNTLLQWYLTEQYNQEEFENLFVELLDNKERIPGPHIYQLVHEIGVNYYTYKQQPEKALEIAKSFLVSSKSHKT